MLAFLHLYKVLEILFCIFTMCVELLFFILLCSSNNYYYLRGIHCPCSVASVVSAENRCTCISKLHSTLKSLYKIGLLIAFKFFTIHHISQSANPIDNNYLLSNLFYTSHCAFHFFAWNYHSMWSFQSYLMCTKSGLKIFNLGEDELKF